MAVNNTIGSKQNTYSDRLRDQRSENSHKDIKEARKVESGNMASRNTLKANAKEVRQTEGHARLQDPGKKSGMSAVGNDVRSNQVAKTPVKTDVRGENGGSQGNESSLLANREFLEAKNTARDLKGLETKVPQDKTSAVIKEFAGTKAGANFQQVTTKGQNANSEAFSRLMNGQDGAAGAKNAKKGAGEAKDQKRPLAEGDVQGKPNAKKAADSATAKNTDGETRPLVNSSGGQAGAKMAAGNAGNAGASQVATSQLAGLTTDKTKEIKGARQENKAGKTGDSDDANSTCDDNPPASPVSGLARRAGAGAQNKLGSLLGGFSGGSDSSSNDAGVEGDGLARHASASEAGGADTPKTPDMHPGLTVINEYDEDIVGMETLLSKARAYTGFVEKRLVEIAHFDEELGSKLKGISERVVGELKDEIRLANFHRSIYGGLIG